MVDRCHTLLESSGNALDAANEQLRIVEDEIARQHTADVRRQDGSSTASEFPSMGCSTSRVMLRKLPPQNSGVVGVLEAGGVVTIEDAAETADGTLRYFVRGRLTGWGNADKFECRGGASSPAADTVQNLFPTTVVDPLVAARAFVDVAASAVVRSFTAVHFGLCNDSHPPWPAALGVAGPSSLRTM